MMAYGTGRSAKKAIGTTSVCSGSGSKKVIGTTHRQFILVAFAVGVVAKKSFGPPLLKVVFAAGLFAVGVTILP